MPWGVLQKSTPLVVAVCWTRLTSTSQLDAHTAAGGSACVRLCLRGISCLAPVCGVFAWHTTATSWPFVAASKPRRLPVQQCWLYLAPAQPAPAFKACPADFTCYDHATNAAAPPSGLPSKMHLRHGVGGRSSRRLMPPPPLCPAFTPEGNSFPFTRAYVGLPIMRGCACAVAVSLACAPEQRRWTSARYCSFLPRPHG